MGFGRGCGNMRTQRVAATSAPFSLFDNESATIAAIPPVTSSSSTNLDKLQAAIAQQNKLLAALISNQSF